MAFEVEVVTRINKKKYNNKFSNIACLMSIAYFDNTLINCYLLPSNCMMRNITINLMAQLLRLYYYWTVA